MRGGGEKPRCTDALEAHTRPTVPTQDRVGRTRENEGVSNEIAADQRELEAIQRTDEGTMGKIDPSRIACLARKAGQING